MFKQFTILSVIILLVSGCSQVLATTQVSSPASGIEGYVTEGPTCPGPVPLEGGTQCADKPYQASFVILGSNSQEVSRFQTDSNGYFKVSLAPGTYTLHPVSEKMLPRAADQSVVVNPDAFTQVTVMFDTGMR